MNHCTDKLAHFCVVGLWQIKSFRLFVRIWVVLLVAFFWGGEIRAEGDGETLFSWCEVGGWIDEKGVSRKMRMVVSLYNDGDEGAARREAQRILRSESQGSKDFAEATAFMQMLDRGKGTKEKGGRTPLAVRAVISFYRSQISPCIGQRCLLVPSCSEYMLQACRKHGVLGVAIGIDRFYREPKVTGDESKMIEMPDRAIKYSDPVSDHDFWMKQKRGRK